jgi:hypothetical protein
MLRTRRDELHLHMNQLGEGADSKYSIKTNGCAGNFKGDESITDFNGRR